MADDKSTAGPTEVVRVNVHEPDDIRDWAKRLQIEEDQFKEIIQAVGTSVNAIKKAMAERAIRRP